MRMVKMLARHTKILELITENKKMEVTKLSQLLSVSQVTIRKDLIQLENSGLIVREHGFAPTSTNPLVILLFNDLLHISIFCDICQYICFFY